MNLNFNDLINSSSLKNTAASKITSTGDGTTSASFQSILMEIETHTASTTKQKHNNQDGVLPPPPPKPGQLKKLIQEGTQKGLLTADEAKDANSLLQKIDELMKSADFQAIRTAQASGQELSTDQIALLDQVKQARDALSVYINKVKPAHGPRRPQPDKMSALIETGIQEGLLTEDEATTAQLLIKKIAELLNSEDFKSINSSIQSHQKLTDSQEAAAKQMRELMREFGAYANKVRPNEESNETDLEQRKQALLTQIQTLQQKMMNIMDFSDSSDEEVDETAASADSNIISGINTDPSSDEESYAATTYAASSQVTGEESPIS